MTHVISEQTLNARRRIQEISEEIDALFVKVNANLNELLELGIDATSIRDEMVQRFETMKIGDDGEVELDVPIGGFNLAPMLGLLDRLFREAPKLTGPDGKVDTSQAPALECHVLLRSAPQPLFGSLSKTPEGALRMLCLANLETPSGSKPVMMEHFFDVDDVVDVMVVREVAAEQSRIHRPS